MAAGLSLKSEKEEDSPDNKAAPVKEGHIVILKEDGTARALWKLAKVVEILEGRDRLIRAARIQLLSNDKPIQHMIPLESEMEH